MGESLGMGPERRESDQEIDELNNRRQALDKQIAEAEQRWVLLEASLLTIRSAINLEKAASDYNAAKNELQKQQDAVHTFEKVSKVGVAVAQADPRCSRRTSRSA